MPVCDICNREIKWEDGYVLTTKQVPTSKAYWEHAFKGAWSYTHSMDPNGDTVAALVKQQAGQSSGWLVCEGCSSLFSFDKAQAKTYARAKNGSPPGAGPAPMESVARSAANVWKRLYGSWPSSIQFAGAESSPVNQANEMVKPKNRDFLGVLGYICAVPLPLVGIIVGIVMLFKKRFGHGIAILALSVTAFAFGLTELLWRFVFSLFT
jgi:hypothetical protein